MFKRTTPFFRYQYEPLDLATYTENGCEAGAKMEGVSNPDVLCLYEVFEKMDLQKAYGWIELNQKSFQESTYIIDTAASEKVKKYAGRHPEFIFNRHSLNTIRHLNTLLNTFNEVLPDGGYLCCHGRTAVLKKQSILRGYVFPLNYLLHFLHYAWHRGCPKSFLLRRPYYAITKGKNRSYHRVEILGRMCRAGFDIVDEEFLNGEFFVLGRKMRAPIWDDEPSCGSIIKLRRIGQGGETIGVYKMRTMYSYSEYLQPYMYKYGGLAEGGKFKDDYRVNGWGHLLRRLWLDELPMLVNWFKGQLKLVGVRPLSRQYFSLYSPEMQALRIKVKPGLIPPFFYEKQTPKTIEDVQESERRYIEAYLEKPFRTDWRYFWGSVGNILFRHKRSK